ncbi:MAG: hypothetical protein OXK76_04025 [Gammaproteobacteria bacterium]|nr:hypothetical protein [Gammaproteobacteria bacterium]
MSYRYAFTRIVDPGAGTDVVEVGLFNLWWAAVSAAEETIQGSPLAAAWLRLFEGHLSQIDRSELRWAGDLAESAEMRRAYSALYGRFFGRAFLASRFGFEDFIPLQSDRTPVGNVAEVIRVKRGDVPDWIAWDPGSRSYVIAEAKGRLGGNLRGYLSQTPACITSGKAQFQRVEVRDAHRRTIATTNWVAANLWCTDRRGRGPVCLLWDPNGEGEQLLEEEVLQHAAAVRRQRVGNIAAALGHPGFPDGSTAPGGRIVRVAAVPSEPPEADEVRAVPQGLGDERLFLGKDVEPVGVARREAEPSSRERHEDAYVAAVMTRFGIAPIVDQLGFEAALRAQDRAGSGEPTLIYGISAGALAGPEADRRGWLSGGGIVSRDGAGLFDITQVEIGEV